MPDREGNLNEEVIAKIIEDARRRQVNVANASATSRVTGINKKRRTH